MKQKKPPSNSILPANIDPPLAKDCGEGQSMLSAGEHVILQTALIEAIDPGQSKSEITRVLMDTGSQRTDTFGESKPKEITSPTVTVLFK